MDQNRLKVAESKDHLRDRVVRMVAGSNQVAENDHQLSLSLGKDGNIGEQPVTTPRTSISEFLGYLCDVLPAGDVYLFGGVLRELALYGRKGFRSDIDIVVNGDWTHLAGYFESIGAKKNRFGGFRLQVNEWPVDIWGARETWAIQKGIVQFQGIESLLRTTILNWDAILMDWRRKEIICGASYFQQMKERLMDIVLEENPNPLGAAVRAFRHLCIKDAKMVTVGTARYLSRVSKTYAVETLRDSERKSFSNNAIESDIVSFFMRLDTNSEKTIRKQWTESYRPFQQLLFEDESEIRRCRDEQ